MLEYLSEANAAAIMGLFGGIALGLAARVGKFCTLGAIEDHLYGHDTRRLRMWGIAVGIAILGTQLVIYNDLLDEFETAYLSRAWNPLATVIGGLIFGYGMAICGNCGFGALARLGGGDMRSLMIVVVMGLSAYFVMSGPLAHFRVLLFPVEDPGSSAQGFTHLFATLGISPILTGSVFGLGFCAIALFYGSDKMSLKQVIWGAVVGLAIVSGWIGTYWIFQNGFSNEPIETHAFAAPIGDTLFYGMTASGNTLSFSVGSVLGVLIGAAAGSFSHGQFRWEACEDPRELRRQIAGAVLMGVGAILTVGCSIGQGISAFSLLTFSAPVVLVSIYLGAWFGLHRMIVGSVHAQ